MYHTMIHPNILQDVSGQYPQMEGDKILTTNRNRYTAVSYTHLFLLMTLKNKKGEVLSEEIYYFNHAKDQELPKTEIRYKAVSYTHLYAKSGRDENIETVTG